MPTTKKAEKKYAEEVERLYTGSLNFRGEAVIVRRLDDGKIDARRFYTANEAGEMRPTPKGITLTTEEWEAIFDAITT